jgi:predicted secreted protein
MKRLSVKLAAGFMFLFCVFPFVPVASAGAPKSHTVTTKVGEVFIITLDSNRSTGYQWVLARPLNKEKVEFICSKYKKLDVRVGEAGEDLLLFKATGPGKIRIYLQYVRLSDKDQKPARRAVYTVVIRPPSAS